jgi:hypothetical protein
VPDCDERAAPIMNSKSELAGVLKTDHQRIWALAEVGMHVAGVLHVSFHLRATKGHRHGSRRLDHTVLGPHRSRAKLLARPRLTTTASNGRRPNALREHCAQGSRPSSRVILIVVVRLTRLMPNPRPAAAARFHDLSVDKRSTTCSRWDQSRPHPRRFRFPIGTAKSSMSA